MFTAAQFLVLLPVAFLLTSCGGSSNGGGSLTSRGASGPAEQIGNDSKGGDVSNIIWQEKDAERPEEVQAEALAPRHYGFMLPVRSIPLATYFYGPRVMSSYEKTAGMVEGNTKHPVILLHAYQNPLESLLGAKMNKYSWEFHGGVDLVAKDGTSIFATNDGIIFSAGPRDCVGETVVIRHEITESQNVVYSIYNHLQKGSYGNLKPGDKIAKGVEFAKSGHTGSPSCIEGPHLHFEMRVPIKGDVSAKAITDWGTFLSETAKVNPADYIKEVDDACQKRKNMEVINANLVQKNEPGALAPLTAGRCGIKYESKVGPLPAIYGVDNKNNLRTLGMP